MPTKKPEPGGLTQFNIRMPKDLVEALDEEVEALRAAHPGRTVSRSDLIREVLYEHVRARRATERRPKK